MARLSAPSRKDSAPPSRSVLAVCVCDLEAMLGLKQPTVSYHLKQFLDAGLVSRQKRGSFAYFSLVPAAFERVRALLGVPALAA